jgi:ubiquinone biosynthesis protein UbiJ
VQWLIDHVRWDIEEDLSRLVGDAPAHAVGQALRRMGEAVRQFAGGSVPPAAAARDRPAPPPRPRPGGSPARSRRTGRAMTGAEVLPPGSGGVGR